MKITLLFVVIITLNCCKGKVMLSEVNRNVRVDTVGPRWIDDGISLYDSIKAPVLKIDTSLIYFKIAEMLKFTNSLKRDDTESFYNVICKVDRESKIKILWRNSTPSLEKRMLRIENMLTESIGIEQPATLIKNDEKIVEYRLSFFFLIEKEKIQFRLTGLENKSFYKKEFKRPL